MDGNVRHLKDYRGGKPSPPPDAAPHDRFQPIEIDDNSLHGLGVFKGDVLFANIFQKSADGQFSYVETPRDFLLGYLFRRGDGWTEVQAICRAPCCPPEYVHGSEILVAAPVVWGYMRYPGGGSLNFLFDERRDEVWETRQPRGKRLTSRS